MSDNGEKEELSLAVLEKTYTQPNESPVFLILDKDHVICARVKQTVLTTQLFDVYRKNIISPDKYEKTVLVKLRNLYNKFTKNQGIDLFWCEHISKVSAKIVDLENSEAGVKQRLDRIRSIKEEIKSIKTKLNQLLCTEQAQTTINEILMVLRLCKLRAELLCLSAHLKLQITFDTKEYSLLFNSDLDRCNWKRALHGERYNTDPNMISPTESNKNLKEIISQIITMNQANHLRTILNYANEINGTIHVTIKHLKGVDPNKDFLVATDIDSHGQFERVARTAVTQSDSDGNVKLNHSYYCCLNHTSTIYFIIYGQNFMIAHHSLNVRTLAAEPRHNSLNMLKVLDEISKTIELEIDILYTENEPQFLPQPPAVTGTSLQTVLCEDRKREEIFCKAFEDKEEEEEEKETKVEEYLPKSKKSLIPEFVQRCAEEIEHRSFLAEGIYRISSSSSIINAVFRTFNSKGMLEGLYQMQYYPTPVVTALLQRFFEGLEEPLIGTNVYTKLTEILGKNLDSVERGKRFTSILKKLDSSNLMTFEYLLRHLIKVSKQEQSTRMDMENLARVWAYHIFRPIPSLEDKFDFKISGETSNDPTVIVSIPSYMLPIALLKELAVAYEKGLLEITQK